MHERVYVDPEIAELLADPAYVARPDPQAVPLAEARAGFDALQARWNWPLPGMVAVSDLDGPVPLRCYRPRRGAALPVIVYLHGGGWTFGGLDSHERACRVLAAQTDAAVLAVAYRLAPEHPYPAPLEDVLTVLDRLPEIAAGAGLDAARWLIAGDSAGANLALGALLRRRDDGASPPLGAGLFYGCFAARDDTESSRRFGGGEYVLGAARMAWFWHNYLGADGHGAAYAEPLRADLTGLPRCYLNVGALDPLHDDSRDLAYRLSDAGVACDLAVHGGLVHGFMQMTAHSAAAARASAAAAAALKTMLAES